MNSFWSNTLKIQIMDYGILKFQRVSGGLTDSGRCMRCYCNSERVQKGKRAKTQKNVKNISWRYHLSIYLLSAARFYPLYLLSGVRWMVLFLLRQHLLIFTHLVLEKSSKKSFWQLLNQPPPSPYRQEKHLDQVYFACLIKWVVKWDIVQWAHHLCVTGWSIKK